MKKMFLIIEYLEENNYKFKWWSNIKVEQYDCDHVKTVTFMKKPIAYDFFCPILRDINSFNIVNIDDKFKPLNKETDECTLSDLIEFINSSLISKDIEIIDIILDKFSLNTKDKRTLIDIYRDVDNPRFHNMTEIKVDLCDSIFSIYKEYTDDVETSEEDCLLAVAELLLLNKAPIEDIEILSKAFQSNIEYIKSCEIFENTESKMFRLVKSICEIGDEIYIKDMFEMLLYGLADFLVSNYKDNI